MAFFVSGWVFPSASPVVPCMGQDAPQYRDSKDCKVTSAGIKVRTGRKWKAEKAVEVAESRLRQKKLVRQKTPPLS